MTSLRMPPSAPFPPHRLVSALVEALPQQGEVWPVGERAKWLAVLSSAFALIYRDGDDGVA